MIALYEDPRAGDLLEHDEVVNANVSILGFAIVDGELKALIANDRKGSVVGNVRLVPASDVRIYVGAH